MKQIGNKLLPHGWWIGRSADCGYCGRVVEIDSTDKPFRVYQGGGFAFAHFDCPCGNSVMTLKNLHTFSVVDFLKKLLRPATRPADANPPPPTSA